MRRRQIGTEEEGLKMMCMKFQAFTRNQEEFLQYAWSSLKVFLPPNVYRSIEVTLGAGQCSFDRLEKG